MTTEERLRRACWDLERAQVQRDECHRRVEVLSGALQQLKTRNALMVAAFTCAGFMVGFILGRIAGGGF